jgi:hypothetical protein
MPCYFPLFLQLIMQKEDEDDEESFRGRLTIEERRKRDRRLPRPTLVCPYRSPWEKVFKSGDDQAMITLCGLDCKSFRDLHEGFKWYYTNFSPYSADGFIRRLPLKQLGGRPRLLSSEACLGLALTYTRTMGGEYILQAIFGATGSPLNLWLKFARRIIVEILNDDPAARVRLPTDEEVQSYKDCIEESILF